MSERERNPYLRKLRRDEIFEGACATIGTAAAVAAGVKAGIDITHHDIPRGIQMAVEGSVTLFLAAYYAGRSRGIRSERKTREALRDRFRR